MRKLFLLLFVGFLIFLKIGTVHPVFSDELDDINKQLSDLQSALSASQKATAPLESQLSSLQKQLQQIENRISAIDNDIIEKKKIIDEAYKELTQEKDIFNKTVRDYYIKNYSLSPLLVFLSSSDAADVTRFIIYQKKGADRDKERIVSFALKLTDLEERKKNLEEEQQKLSDIKTKLEPEKEEIAKVVKGAKDYQANLSTKIAQLSARQQEILGQRLASLHIPRSAGSGGSCSSDLTNGKNPGFSPKIAFFTYGVPNRVGLSQYGAWGRAKAGQGYEDILHAYYNFDSISDTNQSTQIHVTGSGVDWTGSVEDYMKRIYEVPDSWADNNLAALKAQAVAARSYVLAYTNNGGGTICPTDSCQVFKTDPKGGNWEQAVNATAGKVMIQGGNPIKAWFSSTHGGYVHSSSDIGWSSTSFTKNGKDTSTDSIGSFSDLNNNAYDKDSPWFYCDWGSRSAYDGTAWLKPDEVADIVNVILLARKDSSTGKHLYQTDKPNPEGTDTWDAGRVRQELGGGYTSVSSISVSTDFGSGKTTSVSVNGDGGSQSFDASEFKNWFNLRAPANLQIVGPLFNVEQ